MLRAPFSAASSSRRPRLSLLVSASLLLVCSNVACLKVDDSTPPDGSQAEVPANGQALLDRYVKAIGGEATLRSLSVRTVEADMTLNLGQECEAGQPGCIPDGSTGKFLLQNTADGRMYRRITVNDIVDERGFDGEVGWQLQPEPARVILEDPSAIPSIREDAYLHWYFDLEGRGIEMELLPSRDTDAAGQVRPLDGVRWKSKTAELPRRERWFDRSTGLLVEELEIDGEGDEATTRLVQYSDYRDVDGTKVAYKVSQTITQGDSKQHLDFQLTAVKHEPVPESMFAMPRLAAPEPTPDPFLAALADAQRQVEAAPKEATAAIALARSAWTAAHFTEAKSAAETTLKLDSKEPEAMWLLTQIALLDGDLAAAERWAKKSVSAGVDPRRRDLVLATIALHERDFGKAAKLFDAAGVAPLAERYRSFEGKPYAAAGRDAPCRATLPLVPQAPAAIILVEADGEPLRLLVDTTAPDLIVGPAAATRLVLTADTRTPITEDGTVTVGHGRIEKFTLGTLNLENLPTDIYPEEAFRELSNGMPVDGILGTRAFQDGLLRIDAPNGRLDYVRGGAKCKSEAQALRQGESVPFWMHQTHAVYVRGYLGASEGLYMFNTGMRGAGLTANDPAFARAGIAPPPLQPGRASFVRIDDFRIGSNVTVRPQRAAYGYMQEQMTGDQFRFDGMVGFEAVVDRSFTIDYPARTLYFGTAIQPAPAANGNATPPASAAPQTPAAAGGSGTSAPPTPAASPDPATKSAPAAKPAPTKATSPTEATNPPPASPPKP